MHGTDTLDRFVPNLDHREVTRAILANPLATGDVLGRDESGRTILAVAIHDPEYNSFQEASELPIHRLALLRRFFQDYKTLEGKSVEVDDFQPAAFAMPIIEDALQRYSAQRRKGFALKH